MEEHVSQNGDETPSATTPDVWDVVVVGAGPAGAVAACVLAAKGRRVLVVDGQRRGPRQEQQRVVGESLPGAARKILRDTDLMHVVTDGPHLQSVGTASAWESSAVRVTDALRNPDGPGWHLDRARFNADLRAAAGTAGAEIRTGLVRDVSRSEDGPGWSVRWTEGTVEARWVIDASGRAAAVGRNVGAERHTGPPLVALVRWARPASTVQGEAWTTVEAVPEGWWYTAPLPDGSRVAALHVHPEEAQSILQSDAWDERVSATTHVGPLLDGATWEAAPRGVGASGAWTEAPGGAGWLAVGDAATSFDPISSQGLFNSLYTGMKGAEAVDAGLEGRFDATDRYVHDLRRIHVAHLRRWRETYARQTRWKEDRFWG